MEVNFTRLQDWIQGFDATYNLSLAFSAYSCPNFEPQKDILRKEDPTISDGSFIDSLYSMLSLLDFFSGKNDEGLEENHYDRADCKTIVSFNFSEKFSSHLIFIIFLVLFPFVIWTILQTLRCLYCKTVSLKHKSKKDDSTEMIQPAKTDDAIISENVATSTDLTKEKEVVAPIRVLYPARCRNQNERFFGQTKERFELTFDSTLSLFLKQLESYFGLEIQQLIQESFSNLSSAAIPLSKNVNTIVQSPRVRRKWSRPQDINPTFQQKIQTAENNVKYWMLFEMFCKNMHWSHSKYHLENHYVKKNEERAEAMNVFMEFLHQSFVSNSVEWNVSVSVVNYALFLLREMLNVISDTGGCNEVLGLSRFESFGSASNGSLFGKPDHFDAKFVIEFNKAADLIFLHNHYCDEIPPGHVVIGVKNIDTKNALLSNGCLYKGQIKDTFGYFLLCNQVERVADEMMRKAVKKLNTEYQHRMERLPFKLKMNFNDSLLLTIDTGFLNGLGLGLHTIVVRIIPSLCIRTSEFELLPKLHAVPSWRVDHRKKWEGKDKQRVGALAKLFLRGANTHIPSSLFWNLSVSEFEARISEHLHHSIYESQNQTCYEECLIILKALFSSRNKQALLNRGEINSYFLSTVVNFLLMESSSSAWKLSELPNRVSDAIHFLKSSYTNVLLPNFIIHNPHLTQKFPILRDLSPMLTDRQQNLLADVDANSASKTLAFIDSRLRETGLNKFLKSEYSEEMWEYEFFLFG